MTEITQNDIIDVGGDDGRRGESRHDHCDAAFGRDRNRHHIAERHSNLLCGVSFVYPQGCPVLSVAKPVSKKKIHEPRDFCVRWAQSGCGAQI